MKITGDYKDSLPVFGMKNSTKRRLVVLIHIRIHMHTPKGSDWNQAKRGLNLG